MSDLEWKEVPQGRRSARTSLGLGRYLMRLVLRQREGKTMLDLMISADLAESLGWSAGDRLGFSIGSGIMSGHVKFYKQPKGRRLSLLPNSTPIFIARFIAPTEWKALKGDLKIAAFSNQADDAVLVAQVPALHDDLFGETDAGTGPVGHEVAA
jgi:hypothetical protein